MSLAAFLAYCICEIGSDILGTVSYRRGVDHINNQCAVIF